MSIKHSGKELPYQVFNKPQHVNQGAVVDNKRLGAVLSFAKRNQEERSERSERTRSAKKITTNQSSFTRTIKLDK